MSFFKKKKEVEANKEPETLISDSSPICDVEAFVEKTANCVYMYMVFQAHSEEPQMCSCWVCNLAQAPEEMDYEAMNRGEAPMMPAANCKNPAGEGGLKEDELSLVWLEEGNGVALMEGDRLVALVPPWACGDMPGYSVFARETGPFAWSMDQAYDTLMNRVKASIGFWEDMDQDYWPQLQESRLKTVEEFLGTQDYKYYAIDGGEFPPKALICGERGDRVYGLTLGVCVLAQPNVDQYHQDDAVQFRRIELGFACTKDIPEETVMGVLQQMAGYANIPWNSLSWLGHEHTVSCGALAQAGFPAVTLVNTSILPQLKDVPSYPDFREERVNLLWLVPITGAEYEKAKEKDMPVDVLMSLYEGNMDELLIFDGQPKFLKA